MSYNSLEDEPPIPGHLADIAVNMADEGIPVSVIARCVMQPSEDVRLTIQEAIDIGKITHMPADDWPANTAREDRRPIDTRVHNLEVLSTACLRVFKITPLEAEVLALLIKRSEAYKIAIHQAIEAKRMRRSSKPNSLEETSVKMVDVIICKLRKRLKKYSISIETLWGKGYYMHKENRQKALSLLSEYMNTGDVQEVSNAGKAATDFAGADGHIG